MKTLTPPPLVRKLGTITTTLSLLTFSLLTPKLAYPFPEYPCMCDQSLLNCETDPPATGTLTTPATPSDQVNNHLFVESMYASFGSRYPLKPRKDTNGISPFFAQHPIANSTLNYTSYPSLGTPDSNLGANHYAPLNVQAIYEDDMWDDEKQKDDFGHRTIFMIGADISAMNHLKSSANGTRHPEWDNDLDNKYTIGGLFRAIGGRGTSNEDTNNMMGINASAFTAFDNDFEIEENGTLKRAHAGKLSGGEFNVMVGRYISAEDSSGKIQGPVDTRLQHYKEDDLWNLTPSMIGVMAGNESTVWLDNKASDQLVDPMDPNGPTGGYIGTAYAYRGNAIAVMPESYVNVGAVRGLQLNYALLEWESFQRTDGAVCVNERCASPGVGDYMAIEVTPIYDPCYKTQKTTGMMIFDQAYQEDQGGGSPMQSSVALSEEFSEMNHFEAENGSSIITRGDVIIGDGQSSSGYGSDVLHVRDLLHLEGRTEAPHIESNTQLSDRVGLLYFDVTRNTLCVSLASGESEVVWADVNINPESLRPATIVDPATKEPVSDEAPSMQDLQASVEEAKSIASAGESKFVAPRLKPALEESLAVVRDADTPTTFFLQGFAGVSPRIYWRLVPKPAKDQKESTDWREIPASQLQPIDGLPASDSAITIMEDYTADESNQPEVGDRIEFLAVNPETGHATGAALRIREFQ